MRKYSTTTNEAGFFVFPPVQPGNYEIIATSPGMETWKGAFLLAVGQTAEIRAALKTGAVTTQVTVGDAAPLLTTTEATISRNLERARIEQLPIDGRSIANLVLLSTPGLVGGQDGAINPINTGLRDAVELYQDGAVKKNRDVGDWAGRLPGVDSVQELRGNQPFVGEVRPARVGNPFDKKRDQQHPWKPVRDEPEQRDGGGPPAPGFFRQAAALCAQRVRRIGGRSGVRSENLQWKEPHIFLHLL